MPYREPPLHRIAPLLLIPATWLVWHAALAGGFIFDDFPNLVRADGWKAKSLAPDALLEAMRSGVTGNGGRPLAILSFAINHALTGLAPWWLKATSLALHAVNAVLVALLVRRLLDAAPIGGGRGAQTVAACLTALAWASHPIQASTVAYVVQRMEIGAATGVLLALLAYIGFRRRQLAGAKAWPLLLLAGLAWAFGLGFKESAAIAPALALLVEGLCFGFRSRDGSRDRLLVGAYALGGIAATAAFVMVVLPMTTEAAYARRAFDANSRLSTQFPVLCHYLWTIVWPTPDAFRFYYDDFPVSPTPWHDARTLLSVTAILAILLGAWLLRHRWPVFTFGALWFFACHVITSSPIPLELAFEHRNYLALLGPLLIVATGLAAATSRLHADARGTIACAFVLGVAALGAMQAATWGSPAKLALTLENRAPESARAAYGFATHMIKVSGGDRSTPAWSLGMATLRRASDLSSASPLVPQAIIVLHGRQRLDVPEGTWDDFRRLLLARRIGPEAIESLYAVVQCRVSGGCRLRDDELVHTLLEVIRANPRNPIVHTMYANVAWNVLGDRDLALAMQREAVELSRDPTTAKLGLAEFLFSTNRPEARREALALLEDLRRPPRTQSVLEAIARLEARYAAPETTEHAL